ITAVSVRVQKASQLVNERSQYLSSDSLQGITAAGILGFELSQQGFTPEVFRNGAFIQLYRQIFSDGPASPKALSTAQSKNIVQSLVQTEYKPKPFEIVQDV